MRIADLTPAHLGRPITLTRPGVRGCQSGTLESFDLTLSQPMIVLNGHLMFADLTDPVTVHEITEVGGL